MEVIGRLKVQRRCGEENGREGVMSLKDAEAAEREERKLGRKFSLGPGGQRAACFWLSLLSSAGTHHLGLAQGGCESSAPPGWLAGSETAGILVRLEAQPS